MPMSAGCARSATSWKGAGVRRDKPWISGASSLAAAALKTA
jgi:hypothetical protein